MSSNNQIPNNEETFLEENRNPIIKEEEINQLEERILENLWKVVEKDNRDFSAWENLIKASETDQNNQSISSSSSEKLKENLKQAYNKFLQSFPLCFGYWKKWADFELLISGVEEAKKVLKK